MLKDIAPRGHAGTVRRARILRSDMTLPEVLLWRVLRSRPNGVKFRRQHPTGPYILDFFCADARLAIEVDGEAHSRGDRPERDEARNGMLAASGIETLRVPAVAILADLDVVLEHILATAGSRLPLHHPAAPGVPPPRDKLGEE